MNIVLLNRQVPYRHTCDVCHVREALGHYTHVLPVSSRELSSTNIARLNEFRAALRV